MWATSIWAWSTPAISTTRIPSTISRSYSATPRKSGRSPSSGYPGITARPSPARRHADRRTSRPACAPRHVPVAAPDLVGDTPAGRKDTEHHSLPSLEPFYFVPPMRKRRIISRPWVRERGRPSWVTRPASWRWPRCPVPLRARNECTCRGCGRRNTGDCSRPWESTTACRQRLIEERPGACFRAVWAGERHHYRRA